MSPSGSVGLMFDILRCVTIPNGTLVPVGLIEIRKRGNTANSVLERPRTKKEIGLDKRLVVRYV